MTRKSSWFHDNNTNTSCEFNCHLLFLKHLRTCQFYFVTFCDNYNLAATKTCLKQNITKKGKRTTRKKNYKWIQNKKSKQQSYGIFKYYKSSVDCRTRCWLCIILKNNRLLLIAENKLTTSNYNANEQMDLSRWFIFWDSSREPEQKSTGAVMSNQNLLTRFFF